MADERVRARLPPLLVLAVVTILQTAGSERALALSQGVSVYERDVTLARERLDVAVRAHGRSSLESARATGDLVRALLLDGRGSATETRVLAEEALKTTDALLVPGDDPTIVSLVNLGDVMAVAAEYDGAIRMLERAVALTEGTSTVDATQRTSALDSLGVALTAAGRHDAALNALEQSLRLKEAASSGPLTLARTLEALARAAQNIGAYERAGAAIRQARALMREVSPEHPVHADVLNRLAQQLWFEGRLSESKLMSEQALAVAERTLRPDHPTVARSLRYLGGTLADLGDLAGAQAVRARALAIVEREFGPDHVDTGLYLNSMAMAQLELGDYPAARRGFQRVLRIMESRLGPWHDFVATALLNLALADARLGDYTAARREQRRATAIWERSLGRTHPYVALALTEIATAFTDEGQPFDALPLLERALAIRERTLGANHRDVARTAADLSIVLGQVGQITRARTLATRALEILERQDAPDAPELARALMLHGQLEVGRGSLDVALQSYRRAAAIRERTFGRAHPDFAEAQAGVALVLAMSGDPAGALRAAATAEITSRDHLRLLLAHLPERQSLNYAARRPRGLDLILSLGASGALAASEGLDHVIRGRALVLDEMAARQAAKPADAETAALAADLASTRQRLANLLVRGPSEGSVKQHAALVDEVRRDIEVAEEQLVARSATFRAEQRRTNVGIDQVAAALDDDAALVSFVRYRRTILGTELTRMVAGTAPRAPRYVDSYLAFVLRRGVAAVSIPLGSATRIDALVAEWRRALTTSAADTAAGPPGATHRDSGSALRRLIWDPIAAHLQGMRLVFIVPDGSLSLAPFSALPVGVRSYLLDRGPVLHYLSAERDLMSLPVERGRARGLLAIGGPSFDDRRPSTVSSASVASVRGPGQPCAGLQSVRFLPLTGTLREVQDVSAVWRANVEASVADEAVHVVTGAAATEQAFKADAPLHRVLHLATHGFFLSTACAPPPSGSRGVGGLAKVTATRQQNPLLLSGLALAGANRRSQTRAHEDDGILTAEEVASLDLSGAEWAVLSACDTGLGEIKAGEGVFGLRRAFQVAGARTVIMSLWSVDDQATRAWMRALYEGRFQRQLSTADAVHQASLTTLRDRRTHGLSTHPFFWGAFVAAGDWR